MRGPDHLGVHGPLAEPGRVDAPHDGGRHARGLAHDEECDDPECTESPHNFEPKMILDLSSGSQDFEFSFDIDSDEGRANSLPKIDTLLAALRVFRQGLVDEFEPYDRRERELEASRE